MLFVDGNSFMGYIVSYWARNPSFHFVKGID